MTKIHLSILAIASHNIFGYDVYHVIVYRLLEKEKIDGQVIIDLSNLKICEGLFSNMKKRFYKNYSIKLKIKLFYFL